MAITASDVLAVIQSRPQTIPDGLDEAVISSYVDEAKPIMLEYCTLPQNIQEVPDVLKYPWVEIATSLMNNDSSDAYSMSSTSSGAVKSISEGDTTIQYGTTATATSGTNRAAALNSVSANNIRIMDSFRSLF